MKKKNIPAKKKAVKKISIKKAGTGVTYRPICITQCRISIGPCTTRAEAQRMAREHELLTDHVTNIERCR